MGPGQKFLTRVGSGQFFAARVGAGQPFMVWVWIWKISPKNVNLGRQNLFGSESTRVEGGPASYLLRVKSKLGLGQGPSLVLSKVLITTQPWKPHCPKVSKTTLLSFLPDNPKLSLKILKRKGQLDGLRLFEALKAFCPKHQNHFLLRHLYFFGNNLRKNSTTKRRTYQNNIIQK